MFRLCSDSDVADWWSDEGVTSRLDDDADGEALSAEADRMDVVIGRASSVVGSKLVGRYGVAALGGVNPPATTPESIKYFTAIIAAYYLATRRGNPVPGPLAEDYKQILAWLDEIAAGTQSLVDVFDTVDSRPFTSNFTVRGDLPTSKVRVVRSISTPRTPSTANVRRAFDLLNYFHPYE